MQNVTLSFKRDLPITITPVAANTYNVGDTKYNQDLKSGKQSWHLITVFHNMKCTKIDILNAIFEIIEDNEFFPVCYKEGTASDYFVVRQCWEAIDKLFQNKLLLNIKKLKDPIKLQVSLNAAQYVFGQVSPVNKLHQTIEIQLKNLKNRDGIRNVVDLENLNNHPHLEDVYVHLGNKAVFKHLITYLKEMNSLSSVNGLNLSHNQIKFLVSFRILEDTKIQMINLKENSIKSTQQLNFLTGLKFTDIYLAGNPVCDKKDYVSYMNKTFENLKKSDVEANRIVPFETSASHNRNSYTNEGTFSGSLPSGFGVSVRNYSSMQKYSKSTDWHQIIVEHQGKYKKEEIAEQIFLFFSSQEISGEFFLCYYKVGSTEDSFLVRKCFQHLEFLMKNDLKITVLEHQEELPIRIIMNYAPFEGGQVEPSTLILEIASSKSYNPMERCLNLEAFNSKTEMKDVYINISNPKLYNQLLQHSGRKYLAQVVEVRLGYNEISNCKGLKALNTMKNLKVLMLNHNRIKSIADLENISHTNIKDLRLDGNPLCKAYDLAINYISDVCELFPQLTTLDGVPIEHSSNVLSYRKNFICSLEAYDITEQFVGNYFRIYDSHRRVNLSEMYHENAIFTLCYTYTPKRFTDENRLEIYERYDRNLISTTKVLKNFFHDERNITKVFENLPKTEHDLFSFTTDTSFYNSKMVVITVTGVFKDISENAALESEILIGFSRTFVLSPSGSKVGLFKGTIEYEITNDQLTLFNPTENHIKNAFKFTPPEIELTCTANDNSDKMAYIIMLQKLTKLKEIWATKFLEEGKWDFEDAVKYFVEKMEKGEIPKESFLENS